MKLHLVAFNCCVIFNFTGSEKSNKPLVVWRMKAPEKKPLVRREAPDEVRAKVRKGKYHVQLFEIFISY